MPEHHSRALRDTLIEATAGERPWGDVGGALTGLVGARTVSLWVGNAAAGRVEIVATSFAPEVERRYAAYYHRHDLWSLRGPARPAGVLLGTDVVEERELRGSEVYADFFRGLGLFQLVAAFQRLGAGEDMLALGLHRPEADRPFEREDADRLAQALPDLARALRLRRQLLDATGAAVLALAGMASLGAAALLLDRHGRILHANDAARALLGAGRGLLSRGGRCLAAHPADAPALGALCAAAADGLGGHLRLRPGPGGPPLTLLAQRPADGRAAGFVMLLLLDPAAPRAGTRARLLRDLHGLTQAEAEVAEASATGLSAPRIAAARGTSEATVRAQLRAALEKTGQPNLRALAALVAGLPG